VVSLSSVVMGSIVPGRIGSIACDLRLDRLTRFALRRPRCVK
jgi:hypothetical protein